MYPPGLAMGSLQGLLVDPGRLARPVNEFGG
jgi:hypothetical protein